MRARHRHVRGMLGRARHAGSTHVSMPEVRHPRGPARPTRRCARLVDGRDLSGSGACLTLVMRKSPFGPLRCDRCEQVLSRSDLLVLDLKAAEAICMGCRSPLERTRVLVKLNGTRCLFCGAQLLLPDLVDHFNRRHGRAVVNW